MASSGEPLYRIKPLGKHHDRASFRCGIESLDAYLKTQASQDVRRKANAVFALVPENSTSVIAGYFTLCAFGLSPGAVPDAARKHLPRYPVVSATLLGRLAVDTEFQGRGIGSLLLSSALRKAYENADVVGSSMIVVDAIDERAAGFYQGHGFIQLPESTRLVLPMQTIEKLVHGAQGR
jgi:GNAT superfamily N-acetyltransferase